MLNNIFEYSGEEITLEFDKQYNLNKTIIFNNEEVDSILSAGNYIVNVEIDETNYCGNFSFDIVVNKKEVEISFNKTTYEYTGENIELDYALTSEAEYSISIYYNDNLVENALDLGKYLVKINVNDANFYGSLSQIINVVITDNANKINYAISKFYELNSYNLSGKLTIKNGLTNLVYTYNSKYNKTDSYYYFEEDYVSNSDIESNISFFLYCENNNYEYEKSNDINKEYNKYLTENRDSDISNLGLTINDLLKECSFVFGDDDFEYSLNSIQLENMSKYYSYIFNTVCSVSACNVNASVNSVYEIEEFNISLSFNINGKNASDSINYKK